MCVSHSPNNYTLDQKIVMWRSLAKCKYQFSDFGDKLAKYFVAFMSVFTSVGRQDGKILSFLCGLVSFRITIDLNGDHN